MKDHYTTWATLLLVVTAVILSAPALSQAEGGDASLTDLTYAGEAMAETDSGETLVWREGAHRFTVGLSSTDGLSGGSLCLGTTGDDQADETELSCRSVSVSANETVTVSVDLEEWPANATGEQTVRATVRTGDEDALLDEASTALTVIERDGDVDDDGLANEREVSLGTELRINDTDGDGLADGVEVHTYETDPKSNDTDGDGLLDREEIVTYQTDPSTADTDGDGLSDDVEVSNGTSPTVADTDGDGLDDALELNPYGTDGTSPDTDGDGLDDGAEVRDHGTNPTETDTDGDALTDNFEIHTYETDPNAIDTDGDGLEDGAEVSRYRTDPKAKDTDGDGLLDGAEVNTHQTNPTKADTDGDGLDDAAEVNRFETDPLSADTDGDGVSDPQEVDDSRLPLPATVPQLAIGGGLIALLVGLGVYRRDGSVVLLARSLLPGTRRGGGARGDVAASDTEHAEGRDSPGPNGDEPSRPPDAGSGVPVPAAGGADTASEDSGAAPAQPSDADEVDYDLLPNAEVVTTVLEENDGQIRQSELVDETGWSKAKVSRVLSRMESDEEIVKVSVGRGNLITTPDDVPPGARSPFEE